MKIAVLLPNWVGDLAMATPALRSLRQHFPDAQIVGVLKPYLKELLAGNDWLDEIVPCQHQRWFGSQGFLKTVGSLRKQRLDCLVSLRGTVRGGMMAVASGARQRIGFGKNLARRCYQQSYQPVVDESGKQIESAVDIYLQTVQLLGCSTEQKQLEMTTTLAEEQRTSQTWRRLSLPDGQDVVLLHAGSAQGSAKMWPVENAARLAREIVDHWGCKVVVNCGPAERELAREIEQHSQRIQVVSLADEPDLPFGLLKGIIRRVGLVVSTDSGPRHLAAALGTPVVALFGAMDPRLSHNYHPQEKIVRLDLTCMPCNDYTCPLQHLRCMRGLSPQQVLIAASSFRQPTPQQPLPLRRSA